MTEAEFWIIIGKLPPMPESSPEERMSQLQHFLISLPESKIAAFDRIFENLISGFYRSDILDASVTLRGGPHDEESFFSLVCGVMCLGYERYHQILASPESLCSLNLAELDNMVGDWMLYYVASDRLAETADEFEDTACPAGLPPLIKRPRLEGLVRVVPSRTREYPVGSPWNLL